MATNVSQGRILESLGIQRIIQVDDANASAVTFEHLWDTCAALNEAQWLTLGIDFQGQDSLVWRDIVEATWNDLNETQRAALASGALALQR